MKKVSKMKKSIITLTTSATLILGSFTPLYGTPSSVEASGHVQEAKILSDVNFRTSPSINSGRYGTLPSGATVEVVDEVNSSWLKVKYKGREGYISSLPRFVKYENGQASRRLSPPTGTEKNSSKSTSKSAWEKKADQIIQDGLKLQGAPYKFGARAGSGYYDCSLFTQTVYRENGIYLPRNSRQQYKYVDKIKTSELRKGDLVFFDTKQDGRIDHVAIYMGDRKLLHTYKKGIGVTVNKVNRYWISRYVGAGRVIQ
jgi:cell wall-associated NlpC family hydrolase